MQGDDEVLTVALGDSAAGLRLDRALAEALPDLSRERLKTLIKGGRVSDERGTTLWDPSAKAVPATLELRLPKPAPAHNVAQDLDLVVAYEDEHLIVVDKPAGLVVHPAAGNLDGTLVNALLHHCAGQLSGVGGVARPGIVHRIDKDTSGLMTRRMKASRSNSPRTASTAATSRSRPGGRSPRTAASTPRSRARRPTARRWRWWPRAAASMQ
jgi:23S rRNA pseudouridine1911/1915/1917 synthase